MCTFAPTRTVERQVHYLKNWFEEHTPLLAFNGEDKPEGYLLLSRRRGQYFAYEVAANTWPAVLAMLQYQNNLYEGELESQAEVSWQLPLTDATYYLMADHLLMRS
jgi:hypothetical protein